MDFKYERRDMRVSYLNEPRLQYSDDERILSPLHDSAIGSEEYQLKYQSKLADNAYAHGRDPSLLNLSENTQIRDWRSLRVVTDSGYNSRNISRTPSEEETSCFIASQFETDAPWPSDFVYYFENKSIETPSDVKISDLDEDAAHKPKLQKSFRRQPPPGTLPCPLCHDHPQGYHDEHELRRHIDQHHTQSRRVWICKEAQPGGTFLAGCVACRNEKPYGANYYAAGHLLLAHFNPSNNTLSGWDKKSEGKGGTGIGDWSSTRIDFKDWMYEALEVHDGNKLVFMSLHPSPVISQSDSEVGRPVTTSGREIVPKHNLSEAPRGANEQSKASDDILGIISRRNVAETYTSESSMDFPQSNADGVRPGTATARQGPYSPMIQPIALPADPTSSEVSYVPSTPQSPSLSRAVDSSRSLLSISEGELSFMGVEQSQATEMPPSRFNSNTVTFLNGLAQRIVDRCIHGSYQHRPRMRVGSEHTSSSESASSSQPSTRTTSATSQSSNLLGLHPRGIGFDEPDDDDTSKRSPVLKRKVDEEEPLSKLFACPYSKFNPSKYSRENLAEPAYWNCSNCCLRDISRLKQHLYRIHKRPDYYCGSCFKSYKSREQLDEHTRQRPPCELQGPKYEDKMTDDQFHAIKRRMIRGDPCELWFNIYSVLFPSSPRPSSPFVTTADATMINHFVNLFRWVGPEELMSMMLDRRQQPGQNPPLDLSTQAIVDEAFEIALPNYLRQTESRSSQPCMGPAVEDSADEDVFTMAPTRSTTQSVALSNYYEIAGFEPRVPEIAGSIDHPTDLNTQFLNTEGWLAHAFDTAQVNAAFDSYAATDVPRMNQDDAYAMSSLHSTTAPSQLRLSNWSSEISWNENQ
ncbi:uncharacterized protein A1O5_05755 [Cladophialophora psammophila CBS 110553]|uniref:DUF7896 domain-containing protein n=1 Tax=Cladophialophora psammophila CBS 110553 TaxID=1182543 RepID=W9X0A3_9EURO|nr:uncharacterized protein A1O5_05755 [Cladophialophora psammophila CBS 110553]EXJ70765.1 hypothetical protein A1O5_05755 [Cladophialophora psammophila CBS 110553]